MKKALISAFILFLGISLTGQQSFVETSLVLNIEVPVRVFSGNSFVDNLTIKDFELLENGVPQKIDAVYMVKGNSVERREEKRKFIPKTTRTFFLFFELTEYNPRVNDALDYFVKEVLLPGDNLCMVTPMKSYRLVERVNPRMRSESILQEMKEILRRDIMEGNPEYTGIIQDLKSTSRELASVIQERISGSAEAGSLAAEAIEERLTNLVMSYSISISRLENLRQVEELQLIDFAKYLKHDEGSKQVFLFYQREFLPKIDPKFLDSAFSMFQDKVYLQQKITDLYTLFRKDMSLDVNIINRAFADASVSTHFMFIKKPAEHIQGLIMDEGSDDLYSAFKAMAVATGGYVDTSNNPTYLFKNAMNAAENYYLIYYTPKNYVADGKFKTIEIKVRNRRYKIMHRMGYFAN